MMRFLFACLALVLACSTASTQPPADASTPTRGDYDPVPFGGARPVQVYVPNAYTDSKPAPLLILLHGYSASGVLQDLYLNLRTSAEKYGMLYAHPDGQIDSKGNRYWNATDACCDFDKTNVDDSKYLSDLIVEIGTRYKVDPKRVYFVGHSNGAFMSYRMACDHADVVAGIMGIAGETWLDPSKCKPSAPVAILHVQGTADPTIKYDGGSTQGLGGGGSYPGAKTSVSTWATYNGCNPTLDTSSANLDLDDSLPGAETTVGKYAGCKANGQVELWSLQGGVHIPSFTPAFDPAMLDWLLAHPKP
jgi:polyhydroxybutyrate depolymerase